MSKLEQFLKERVRIKYKLYPDKILIDGVCSVDFLYELNKIKPCFIGGRTYSGRLGEDVDYLTQITFR